MKTFDEFITEAEFASRRNIKGAIRHLQGAHGEIRVSTKRRNREEAERTQRLSNSPSGTVASEAQRDIQRQLAAQAAEEKAKQERQSQLSNAARALAAQKEDPAVQAQREKLEKARQRSARRASKKEQ